MIEEKEEELLSLKDKIQDLKLKIKHQVDTGNIRYLNIRNAFSSYVETIIDKPGLLSISQNNAGNIEFKAKIYNSNNEITAEDKGFSYKKILCACFDLAIATSYSTDSFNRFIYHDGCLETLDPRKRKNYLDLVSNLCNNYNLQYILTLIESDLPILEEEKYTLLDDCNVAVELSDRNESCNLFGFCF